MSTFLIALMAATLAANPPREPSWIPIGPPGGAVRALAADPTDARRVYLGAADGMFYRSDDGGRNWQRMSPGFPRRGCSLDEIVVDRNGVVYVGYWEVQGSGGGVARSADGGETFALTGALERESVRALAISFSDPREIVAGTLTGVFLSTDAGGSWKRVTPEGDRDLRNVASLAIDPEDPHVIYVGTRHLAWKTVDGGATWTPIHTGMIEDSHVMTLSIDRRDRQILYATACTGVYRSTNGGGEWMKMDGIPDSSRRTPAFSQGGDGLLVAGTTEGLWISDDAGRKWACATRKDLAVNALLLETDGSMLVGAENGVFLSSDRGRTWTASNTGFTEQLVSKVLFDPARRCMLVAVWGTAGNGGVFASTSLPHWARLGDGWNGRQVTSLALIDSTILAGTDDGVFEWNSGSNSWTRLPGMVGGREMRLRVNELLMLPFDRLLAATPSGVFISSDHGKTWTRPTAGETGDVSSLASSAADPHVVMAVTRSGFFRSDDGGEHWEQASPAIEGTTAHAVAFMPSDPHRVFATTTGGLFRSDDRGATWSRVGGGIPHSDLTGIAVQPDGRTMYLSDFTRGGIFGSNDGGATWKRLKTDGLGSDRVWMLAIDPTAPERLVAAASAGGLHLLTPTPVLTGNAVR